MVNVPYPNVLQAGQTTAHHVALAQGVPVGYTVPVTVAGVPGVATVSAGLACTYTVTCGANKWVAKGNRTAMLVLAQCTPLHIANGTALVAIGLRQVA